MQAKLAGTLALALADMSAAVQVVYLDAQGTITIGDRARLYLKLRGRKINQGGQFARIVDPSRSKTIPQTNLLLPCCFWLTISYDGKEVYATVSNARPTGIGPCLFGKSATTS